MADRIPGPTCQETRPLHIDDGTNVLSASPSPGPSTGGFDVSFEIGASYMPPATRLVLPPAQMQVLAALRAYRAVIIEAEKRFRIDRRAIAGAVAWEMLENVRRRSPRSVVGQSALYNCSWKPFDTLAKQTEDSGYLPDSDVRTEAPTFGDF